MKLLLAFFLTILFQGWIFFASTSSVNAETYEYYYGEGTYYNYGEGTYYGYGEGTYYAQGSYGGASCVYHHNECCGPGFSKAVDEWDDGTGYCGEGPCDQPDAACGGGPSCVYHHNECCGPGFSKPVDEWTDGSGYCGEGPCNQPDGACGGGGQVCGGGTCKDGISTYTTICTPSCDADPQDCHDDPACPGAVIDCNTVPGYCEGLEAHCGNAGCGSVSCAPGGNCVTNCTGCGNYSEGSYGPAPSATPTPPPPPEKSPKACQYPLWTDQLTKVVTGPLGQVFTTPTDWANALTAGTQVLITDDPFATAPTSIPNCHALNCSYSELTSSCSTGIQVVSGWSPSGCTGLNNCSDCKYEDQCSTIQCGSIAPPPNSLLIRYLPFDIHVDFSKLAAIFAPPNSNYLEGKYQDQTHRMENILDLDRSNFDAFHGPAQKGAPRVIIDRSRLNYVIYIHGKPRIAEYDHKYSDIHGNNPKTIAELWAMWGKPKPPSLGTPSMAPDPQPEPDCRTTHYPGDKLFQCNVGNSSGCSPINAGAGVPWICNSDGKWSTPVPLGECTTECQDRIATVWGSTWGRYWDKIPTAIDEFYYGMLSWSFAAGTREIDGVANGTIECNPARYTTRRLYFRMPRYFRTASIANQINQLIVPRTAQSSTPTFVNTTLKIAVTDAKTGLSKTIEKIKSTVQKIRKTSLLLPNLIKDIHAKATQWKSDFETIPDTKACPLPIQIQQTDVENKGPFCTFPEFGPDFTIDFVGDVIYDPPSLSTIPQLNPPALRDRYKALLGTNPAYTESCTDVSSQYKLDNGTLVDCHFKAPYQTYKIVTPPGDLIGFGNPAPNGVDDAIDKGWDSCVRVPPPIDPAPSGTCTPFEYYHQCGRGDNFGEGPCDPSGKVVAGQPVQCVEVPWRCNAAGTGWTEENPIGECSTNCTTCYPPKYSCTVTVNRYPIFYVPWLAPIWNNTTFSNQEDASAISAIFGKSLPNTGQTGQKTGRPGVYTWFKPKTADPIVFPTVESKKLPSEFQDSVEDIRQRYFGASDCNKAFSRDISLKPKALQDFLNIIAGCPAK